MGNGDIAVGSKPPPRKGAKVTVKEFAGRIAAAKPADAADFAKPERHCGAMSQQRGDNGMLSTPQKFVRLVGCRDPKARPPGGG